MWFIAGKCSSSWCVLTEQCVRIACKSIAEFGAHWIWSELDSETVENLLIYHSCEPHLLGGGKAHLYLEILEYALSTHWMQWELNIFLKLITLEKSFFKIRKIIHKEKSGSAFPSPVSGLKTLFCGQSSLVPLFRCWCVRAQRSQDYSYFCLPRASPPPVPPALKISHTHIHSFWYLLNHSRGSSVSRPVWKLSYRLPKSRKKKKTFADWNTFWISKGRSWGSSRYCSGCYGPGALLGSA